MSNQTVEPFESDEIDEYIKYNREYRFNIQNISTCNVHDYEKFRREILIDCFVLVDFTVQLTVTAKIVPYNCIFLM